MSTDMENDVERRLRAALSARADLLRAESLAPPAPVVPLRPRWRSPWVVLVAAAAVLVVLGVLLSSVGGRQRADDVAPRPDEPRVVLPPDVGRDWRADDLSTPARLDLDGDGTRERVDFLAEPSKVEGRIRLQTTLSSTGEEAYGIAELGSTIGTNALDPVDADHDGDQELVLYVDGVGLDGGHPLVFDLHDGLLVQAVADDPELLVRGSVPVPGAATEFYDVVHMQDYWVEDGRLLSSRSVEAYATANMTLMAPADYLLDTWEWVLGADEVLRPEEAGCLLEGIEHRTPCDDASDDGPPVRSEAATYVGIGETVEHTRNFPFTARIDAGDPPVLVTTSAGVRTLRHPLDVVDPRLGTVQPESVFYDGVSVVVTSGADPLVVQVLVERDDGLAVLRPVGEVPLENAGPVRTWLTTDGRVLTAVAADGEEWALWQWLMVSKTEMAALPWGTFCFDDIDDPSTMRSC